ncbi:MAG TPA: GtrA family protein [Clostridia bacterium]|nr:GtrA family protein [Clostridia bacterium]
MKKIIKDILELRIVKTFVNRETMLYVLFGLLTTAVNLVVFNIFDKALGDSSFFGEFGYLVANTIAWIVSVIFAFITNKIFVFESKSWELKTAGFEFSSFVGARLFSLFVEQGLMLLMVTHFGVNKNISKLLIAAIVIALNYIFSKLIIFKKR